MKRKNMEMYTMFIVYQIQETIHSEQETDGSSAWLCYQEWNTFASNEARGSLWLASMFSLLVGVSAGRCSTERRCSECCQSTGGWCVGTWQLISNYQFHLTHDWTVSWRGSRGGYGVDGRGGDEVMLAVWCSLVWWGIKPLFCWHCDLVFCWRDVLCWSYRVE